MKLKLLKISALLSVLLFLFCACNSSNGGVKDGTVENSENYIASVNDVPEFDDEQPFVAIRDNIPEFSESDLTAKSYEFYSELDSLGRCGVVMACIGIDIMPDEERGSIGQVKPSGWHTVKYDIVDGKYLYNRCHLIGYQLTGENANKQNLITGTRYLNMDGMLPFENMVADYVKETENHVVYRVTPIFDGNNLVARGVQLEGYSVEDEGEGICFNVYAYNNQPGILINYANGESKLDDGKPYEEKTESQSSETQGKQTYILNTNSKKFHKSDCRFAIDIKEGNKEVSQKSRESLIADGYSPCKTCNP
ncbi:MAG: DNA/RNA non-specific endonuclease [Clostridia bacterium]|nr:DNA/RNA non-specific endonuclease [Clostridia bacterium]